MTDDLVKRLREVKDWWREPGRTAEQAADRIDALEAALLEEKDSAARYDCVVDVLSGRIKTLEAALRVAAGYISTKEGHTDQHPQDVYDWIVSAALAGEKKE